MILVLILIGFIYPLLILIIHTIINRKDRVDILNGCPEIHTIGDIIDACYWRAHHTYLGDILTAPIIGFIASILITIFLIIYLIIKLLWLGVSSLCSLFKINIKKCLKEFFSICSEWWNKFKNIVIFK